MEPFNSKTGYSFVADLAKAFTVLSLHFSMNTINSNLTDTDRYVYHVDDRGNMFENPGRISFPRRPESFYSKQAISMMNGNSSYAIFGC